MASPYTLSAETYLEAAKEKEGEEKQDALLFAAGRLIQDGEWKKGLAVLSQTHPVSLEQVDIKRILQAKTDLMRDRSQFAIKKLAMLHKREKLPLYYQIQYHQMLARAYEQNAKPSESVTERIKLEGLLPDKASRQNNRRELWLTLNQLPEAELNTLVMEASDDQELQGWLRLALVPRSDKGGSHSMLDKVQSWQEEFPQHPAMAILPQSLSQIASTMHSRPRQVALLLPLSGPFSGPGHAVKDGFLAAQKQKQQHLDVRLYDTASASAAKLYDKSIEDGADYVIGPLTKNDVAEVARLQHPVPTLLLNELNIALSDNAYYFGLSPSGEARQVAAKARENGNTRALIIAPSTDWGKDVSGSFAEQWQRNGGAVVDSLYYQSHEDMAQALGNFLHISQSQNREKELKQLLGKKMQTRLRRRQDFDMIFLLAYPKKARQIMPLLKYYYAGDVPVYATSSVYAGDVDTIKNRDLDGIIFCDMPWVFKHQVAGSSAWPEQLNSYNRLYAMGMDSYLLSTQLNQLKLFPAMGASDNSGILFMNSPQEIARLLEWGKFKQGLAVPVSKTV